MPDYSELIFRVKKNNSEAAIQDIGRALEKSSASATQLQHTLAKLVGFVGVAQFAKTLINASDSVRRVDASFKSVYTSTEKANAELKRLQSTFQMTDLKARQSLAHVGQLIRNLVPRDALQDVSAQITELAEDLAVRFNTASEQVRKSLAQALSGRTRGLLQFGVKINVNSDEFKEAVAAQMKAANVTAQQARSMTIMQEIMRQTASAQGEYARSAGSASTQLNNVKNSVTELIAVIADQLNPLMASALSTLNSGIGNVTKMAQSGLVTAGAFTTLLGGTASAAMKMNDNLSRTVSLMQGINKITSADFLGVLRGSDVKQVGARLNELKQSASLFGTALGQSFTKASIGLNTWLGESSEAGDEISKRLTGVLKQFAKLESTEDQFFKTGLGYLKTWGDDVSGLAAKYSKIGTATENMQSALGRMSEALNVYSEGAISQQSLVPIIEEYKKSLAELISVRKGFSKDFVGQILKHDADAAAILDFQLNKLNGSLDKTSALAQDFFSLTLNDFSTGGNGPGKIEDIKKALTSLETSLISTDNAMATWTTINKNDMFKATTEGALSLSETLDGLDKRAASVTTAFAQLLNPNVKEAHKLNYAFQSLSRHTEVLQKTGKMSIISDVALDSVKKTASSLSELTSAALKGKAAQQAMAAAQAKASKSAYLWLTKAVKQELLMNNELSRTELLFSAIDGASTMIENVNNSFSDMTDKAEMLNAVGDKLHDSLIVSLTTLPGVLDTINGKLDGVIKNATTLIGALFSGGGRGSLLFRDMGSVLRSLSDTIKKTVKDIVKATTNMRSAIQGLIRGSGQGLGKSLAEGLGRQAGSIKSSISNFFSGVLGGITASFKALWAGLASLGSKLAAMTGKLLLIAGKAIAIAVAIAAVVDFLFALFRTIWIGLMKLSNMLFKTDFKIPENIWEGPLSKWIAEWVYNVKKIEKNASTLEQALKNVSMAKELQKQFARIRDEVLNFQIDFGALDDPAGKKLLKDVQTSADGIIGAKAEMIALNKRIAELGAEAKDLHYKLQEVDSADVKTIEELNEKIKANAEELKAATDSAEDLRRSLSDFANGIIEAYRQIDEKQRSLTAELDDLKLDTLSDSQKLDELNKQIKEGLAGVSQLLYDPEYLNVLTTNKESFTTSLEEAKKDYDRQFSDFSMLKKLVKKAASMLNTQDLNEIAEQLGKAGNIEALGIDKKAAADALRLLESTRAELKTEYGESIDSVQQMNAGFERHFSLLKNKMRALTTALAGIDKEIAEVTASNSEAALEQTAKLLQKRLAVEQTLNDEIRRGNASIMDFIKHVADLAAEESKLSQNWIDGMEQSAMETWKMQHMSVDQSIDMSSYSNLLKGMQQEHDTKATLDEIIKIKEANISYQETMKKEVQYIGKHINNDRITLEVVNALK